MRLKEIMSPHIVTIAPEDSAAFANELMWRKNIHHLIVIQNGKIVGILSDSDLGGDAAKVIPDNLQVQDAMNRQVVTAKANTSVKEAFNLMHGHHIHCLPVVDDNGKPIGIVTEQDILTLSKRGTAQPPFQGSPQDPDMPLHDREGHGGQSKIDHSMWPGRFPNDQLKPKS